MISYRINLMTARPRWLAFMLLFTWPAFALASSFQWMPRNEVLVDGSAGPIPAIQSIPSGTPLLFGRTEAYTRKPRFYPRVEDEGLVFNGLATAYVPAFWTNPEAFAVTVELAFDDISSDQTVILVTGVFDLRLSTTDDEASLEMYGYREASKPASVRIPGIKAGHRYNVRAGVSENGTLFLQHDGARPATTRLGQAPAHWEIYQDLYVGSANPQKFRRPFKGRIYSLSVQLKD